MSLNLLASVALKSPGKNVHAAQCRVSVCVWRAAGGRGSPEGTNVIT